MLFVTASSSELLHVYAITNADIWKILQTAIAEANVASILGRFTDLGTASSSGTGASQSVSDTDVRESFNSKFPNMGVGASITISRSGDPVGRLQQPGRGGGEGCQRSRFCGASAGALDLPAGESARGRFPGSRFQHDAVFATDEAATGLKVN